MINLPPRPEDELSLWKGTALLLALWLVGTLLVCIPGGGL